MSHSQAADERVAHDETFPEAVDAVRTRRSGHNFDPDEDLADETLEALVRDATLAPSSYNLQPWEFVAVQDEDRLENVVELAYGQEHVREAGTAILVVGHTEAKTADRVFDEWVEAGRMDEAAAEQTKAQSVEMYEDERFGRDYAVRNASLAAQNLLLSAHARGLKATPMIGFDAEGMAELLDLPDDEIPVMLIAVGPSGGPEPERLPRRSVDEVLHRESY
ncbi:nitroreductase family protein [Halegenticoccus tardaugens]|uniref:nitroreductase family protein n=1 Tax=Halegenticoccus tardaugens TaxID=2071624 RepID=UPI00100ACAB1|nr:nitroreductase family protein [Halegenticoccus tardaugens]